MSIAHTLPEIDVRNTGRAVKRKRQKIPTLNVNNGGPKPKFPLDVVCGAMWLRAHGCTYAQVAELLGANKRLVKAWCTGERRPHAKPIEPGPAFWAFVESL